VPSEAINQLWSRFQDLSYLVSPHSAGSVIFKVCQGFFQDQVTAARAETQSPIESEDIFLAVPIAAAT
jgi:hypothetical protein